MIDYNKDNKDNKDYKNYNPLVSILVNCYNGEKYLKEALDSVKDQTYNNWEIIFWDNKSIDNSLNIIRQYKDKRIKCFSSKNHMPLYHARNLALNESKGELIAFLDVDDYWLKDNLNEHVKIFRNNKIGFSNANFFYKNEKNKKKWQAYRGIKSSGYVLDNLLKNYNVALVTLVIRKSILLANNFSFNNKYNYYGDFDLVIKYASVTKLSRIDKCLAVYRIHENNLSKKNYNDQIFELEDWEKINSKVRGISKSANYKWIKIKIYYLKGIREIYLGNRINSFKFSLKIPISILKFKLLFALIIPLNILSKVRLLGGF